jgi:UDP-N-acetyl-2-amino-2-deoxyglucuronate dehydrogenase
MLRSGDIEAGLVCAPHPAHAGLVVAASENGVHLLCEKPISINLAEADEMIDAAKRAGIRFGVIFRRRFWPAARRIRDAIDQFM